MRVHVIAIQRKESSRWDLAKTWIFTEVRGVLCGYGRLPLVLSSPLSSPRKCLALKIEMTISLSRIFRPSFDDFAD